ncbi:hypothetical protein EDD15DRAFT_2192502 [Pisolithus albus]|nr:hypothetical protein EDD15DRAFT_2192502 [Pisolithus albus]
MHETKHKRQLSLGQNLRIKTHAQRPKPWAAAQEHTCISQRRACSVLLGPVQARGLDIWLQRTERNEIMKAKAVACVERCQYRPRQVEGSVMGKTGCKHESFWAAGEWFKILTEWISHEVVEENKLVHWSEEPVTTDKRQSEGSIAWTNTRRHRGGLTRYPECKSWSPEVSRQAHEWIRAGLHSPENATRWAHEHLKNPTISLRRITPVAIALVTLLSNNCAKMGHKISAMRKPTVHVVSSRVGDPAGLLLQHSFSGCAHRQSSTRGPGVRGAGHPALVKVTGPICLQKYTSSDSFTLRSFSCRNPSIIDGKQKLGLDDVRIALALKEQQKKQAVVLRTLLVL